MTLLQLLKGRTSLCQEIMECSGCAFFHHIFAQDEMPVSALKALSSEEPGEEDVLDAGCLLDVLRLYRWHISSFEEQVRQ